MYVWAELYVPTSVLYVCFAFSARQQPDMTVLCYLYLAWVDKGEFQSVSVAGQIIGNFLRKGRENRERQKQKEEDGEREGHSASHGPSL